MVKKSFEVVQTGSSNLISATTYLAVCFRASYLTSLCLSLFICKTNNNNFLLFRENICKGSSSTVPGMLQTVDANNYYYSTNRKLPTLVLVKVGGST